MNQPTGFFGVLKATTHIIRLNPKQFCCISGVLFLLLALQTAFAALALNNLSPVWFLRIAQLAASSSGAAETPDGQPLPPFHLGSSLFFQLGISVLVFIKVVVVIPPLSIIICRGFLNKNVTLKAAIRCIPKAFKGILLTTLCIFAAFTCALILSIIFITVPGFILVVFQVKPAISLAITVLAGILSVMAVTYLTVILHLAYTVTVLEETCGWDALRRSVFLLKGHKVAAFWLILLLQFGQSFIPIPTSEQAPVFSRFSIVVISVAFLTFLSLYDLSTTVVLYITCKLYHNEPIKALTAAIDQRGDEQTLPKYINLGSALELEASSIPDLET